MTKTTKNKTKDNTYQLITLTDEMIVYKNSVDSYLGHDFNSLNGGCIPCHVLLCFPSCSAYSVTGLDQRPTILSPTGSYDGVKLLKHSRECNLSLLCGNNQISPFKIECTSGFLCCLNPIYIIQHCI